MAYGLTWAGGACEMDAIRKFRRIVVKHGGIFHEVYAIPGYAIDATFPSRKTRHRAAAEIAEWENSWLGVSEPDCCTARDFYAEFPVAFVRHGIANHLGEETVYQSLVRHHWVNTEDLI